MAKLSPAPLAPALASLAAQACADLPGRRSTRRTPVSSQVKVHASSKRLVRATSGKQRSEDGSMQCGECATICAAAIARARSQRASIATSARGGAQSQKTDGYDGHQQCARNSQECSEVVEQAAATDSTGSCIPSHTMWREGHSHNDKYRTDDQLAEQIR